MNKIQPHILARTESTAAYRSSDLLHEEYCKIVHKSGLEIYVFPKQLRNTYALFATKYGSTDNCFALDGESYVSYPEGIAHFLEHKLFDNGDGTDAGETFSALGADVNAYTSYTKTAYLFSCTENFRECLSELVSFVSHPHFEPESVEREKSIIAEEIGMYDDSPDEACFCELLRCLYSDNSVRCNICGDRASIARITPKLLYSCYETFYTPKNMVLVVCGDIDAGEVLEIVDKNLPVQTAVAPNFKRRRYTEDTGICRSFSTKNMNTAKPIFNIGIKDIPFALDDRERMKRSIGMMILGEAILSRSGKFYNNLYEQGKLSPAYSFSYSICEDFSFFVVSGEADDPEYILSEFWSYIDKVKVEGIPSKDIERAKRIEYSDFLKSFDSTDEIANNLLDFVFDGYDIFNYPELVRSVDGEYVEKLLREVFVKDMSALSVVYPIETQTNK